MKIPTGVSLSDEILNKLDDMRGFASRSIIIENILRERFGMEQLRQGHRAKPASETEKDDPNALCKREGGI